MVGNTVVIASGDADGANDVAFDSRTAVMEMDFCKATRDDERLHHFVQFHGLGACFNDPCPL